MGFVAPVLAAMGTAAETATVAGTATATAAETATVAGTAAETAAATATAAETAAATTTTGAELAAEAMETGIDASPAGEFMKAGAELPQQSGGFMDAVGQTSKTIGKVVMKNAIGTDGSGGTQGVVEGVTGKLLSRLGGHSMSNMRGAQGPQAQASYDPGQGKAKYSGGNVPSPVVQQQQAPEQLKTFADFFNDNLQKGV